MTLEAEMWHGPDADLLVQDYDVTDTSEDAIDELGWLGC